nr:MAG TPA: hypothetical protein [Caudoviricetes sp.]
MLSPPLTGFGHFTPKAVLVTVNLYCRVSMQKERPAVLRRALSFRPYSVFSSGRPATLVSRLSTPASAEALATTAQLTSPSTALVPIVATAVCATVFTARIAAALSHFFQFLMFLSSSFDAHPRQQPRDDRADCHEDDLFHNLFPALSRRCLQCLDAFAHRLDVLAALGHIPPNRLLLLRHHGHARGQLIQCLLVLLQLINPVRVAFAALLRLRQLLDQLILRHRLTASPDTRA